MSPDMFCAPKKSQNTHNQEACLNVNPLCAHRKTHGVPGRVCHALFWHFYGSSTNAWATWHVLRIFAPAERFVNVSKIRFTEKTRTIADWPKIFQNLCYTHSNLRLIIAKCYIFVIMCTCKPFLYFVVHMSPPVSRRHTKYTCRVVIFIR